MNVSDIFLSLFLICASALMVYLIYSLKKINQTLNEFTNDMNSLTEKSLPILDNVENITGKVSQNIDEADSKIQDLKENIESFVQKFNTKKNKSENEESPENRVRNMVSNLRAFSKGISVFLEQLKNN